MTLLNKVAIWSAIIFAGMALFVSSHLWTKEPLYLVLIIPAALGGSLLLFSMGDKET